MRKLDRELFMTLSLTRYKMSLIQDYDLAKRVLENTKVSPNVPS